MTPGDLRIAQAALTQAENITSEIAPIKGSSALQYILARARKEAVEAMLELQDAPADNAEAIRDLQFRSRLYGKMVEFLREAIVAGDDAAQILNDFDKDELADLTAKDGASDV